MRARSMQSLVVRVDSEGAGGATRVVAPSCSARARSPLSLPQLIAMAASAASSAAARACMPLSSVSLTASSVCKWLGAGCISVMAAPMAPVLLPSAAGGTNTIAGSASGSETASHAARAAAVLLWNICGERCDVSLMPLI